MGRMMAPLDKYFWKHVEKVGDCLVWNGPVNHRGIPISLSAGAPWRRGLVVAAIVLGKELPKPHVKTSMTCGLRRCINPDHAEMWKSKRVGRLTDAQRDEIKNKFEEWRKWKKSRPMSVSQIAREYGVSREWVYLLGQRRKRS